MRRRPLNDVLAVYDKELRTLVRDRHTILYSLCLPLFLYPGLVWAVVQVLTYLRALDERSLLRVIVIDESTAGDEALLADSLRDGHRLVVIDPPSSPASQASPEERARAWLRAREADAVLLLEEGIGASPGIAERGKVFYSAAREASKRAKERVETALGEFRKKKLLAAARSIGEDTAFLEALDVEESDVSTRQELAKYVASLILPLLMIVMTALGAFYPALDATVGEKERGTLETTLLSPVRRESIVLGKYLAVVTFAFFAFFLNFLSMMLTLSHLRSQLKLQGFTLGFASMAVILAAALLLAFFLGAIMMALGFLARTFKEGQSYVTPVYLFSVFPVIATSSPEITLTPMLAIVPVVNISLLFREALQGRLPLPGLTLTFAASALYALLALGAAARLLRREDYRTGGISPRQALLSILGRGGDPGRGAA